MNQSKMQAFYSRIVDDAAELSDCVRNKVGALIVKDDNIISFGFNGTPQGHDNCCEDKVYMDQDSAQWLDTYDILEQWPYVDEIGRYNLKTKPTVLHAEQNAILKLSESGTGSTRGADLYCTFSPCQTCAIMIIRCNFKRVFYKKTYRDNIGLALLRNAGIETIKVE